MRSLAVPSRRPFRYTWASRGRASTIRKGSIGLEPYQASPFKPHQWAVTGPGTAARIPRARMPASKGLRAFMGASCQALETPGT
jgi:hypothetical protein